MATAADDPESVMREVAAKTLPDFTDHTHRAMANEMVAQLRAAGFAIVPREQWERAQAIAARIDDSHRRTVEEAIRRASNADGSARTADWIQR